MWSKIVSTFEILKRLRQDYRIFLDFLAASPLLNHVNLSFKSFNLLLRSETFEDFKDSIYRTIKNYPDHPVYPVKILLLFGSGLSGLVYTCIYLKDQAYS